jgi:PTH1 family peptidyl-tRNA hydrolase
MKCIVGLGNPGRKYDLTRHNVGFRVLDGLEARHKTQPLQSGRSYGLAQCACGPERVHLLRPLTFMNCSGHGLMDYLKDRGTAVSDLLVVTDDVYLPLGRIRIRRSGGDGGHNGMASLVEFLGTESFPRLRIGVGAPADSGELPTYVLRTFPPDEVPVVEESIARACDAVEAFVLDGIDVAMNRFNG